MKYAEPEWKLPRDETFYTKFNNRNELYKMTLPDWEITEKWLGSSRRTCIDVGGHVGTTALRYANNFDKVIAFEPLYVELLKENLAHVDNLTVYPYALSDAEEQMNMVKRVGNSGCSVIVSDVNPDIKKRSGFTRKLMPIETVILDDYNFTDIDFIKMDTEGFVLRPLKGMVKTLEANNYPLLQIEFNNLNKSTDECLEFLADLGYEEVEQFHVDRFFVRR